MTTANSTTIKSRNIPLQHNSGMYPLLMFTHTAVNVQAFENIQKRLSAFYESAAILEASMGVQAVSSMDRVARERDVSHASDASVDTCNEVTTILPPSSTYVCSALFTCKHAYAH
jgi:hypothetical protein